jgi:hypothetical protein
VQLYPPPFGSFFEPFRVTQIDPQNPEAEIRLRVSGYRLDYNSAETVTESGIELLPLTFRIASLESQHVDPPVLTINLLKDANGRLMIASFDTTPVQSGGKEDCNDWPLLCKWRAAVAEKFNSMKSSMRNHCHKHKGEEMQIPDREEQHHKVQPGQMHPRPSEDEERLHHGHRHHRMHRFLRGALFTVVVPILVGVIAGTITYFVGMILGCIIAIVVAKVRGRSAYQALSLEDGDEEEEQARNEKEVYAELPEYDSPPVYEESAEKEVVDEER